MPRRQAYSLHGRELPPIPHGKSLSSCTPEELDHISALFSLFDVDNSGKIDYQELLEGFGKIPLHITAEEAKAEIDQVDLARGRQKDHELDSTEFSMAVMQGRSRIYYTLYGHLERDDGNPYSLKDRNLPPLPQAASLDEVTPEEAANLQLLFALFDIDGGGQISRHEVAIAYSFLGDVDLQAEEVQAHFDELAGGPGVREIPFDRFASGLLGDTHVRRVLYGDWRAEADDPVAGIPERPELREPFLVERPEAFEAPSLTVAVLSADDLQNGSKLHLPINAAVQLRMEGDGGDVEHRTPTAAAGASPRWAAPDNQFVFPLARPLREGDDLVVEVFDHSRLKGRDALLGRGKLHGGDLHGYRVRATRDVTLKMLAARSPCEADLRLELLYADPELAWIEAEVDARRERDALPVLARLRSGGGAARAGPGKCVVS